jgi:predicted ArsR family transcriptional regulator
VTILEIAAKLDVDRAAAYALVNFLLARKLAECVGVRKVEGGKGKGQNVYRLAENLDQRLGEVGAALWVK